MKFLLALLLYLTANLLGLSPANFAIAQEITKNPTYPELTGFKNQNSETQKQLLQPILSNLRISITTDLNKTEQELSEEKLKVLFADLKFLEQLNKSDVLTSASKIYISNTLAELLKKSLFFSPKNLSLDGEKFPYSATLRIQLAFTEFSFAKTTKNFSFFNSIYQSSPERQKLWKNYHLLVLDNLKSDPNQLEYLNLFLSSIPKPLLEPVILTCMACNFSQGALYYFSPYYFVPSLIVWGDFSSSESINIFNVPMGTRIDLPLPEELAFYPVDVYAGVFVHEYSHHVERKFSPKLIEYREATLNLAGKDHQNYLRNMQADGYFIENKAEFFASLANGFFADSNKLFNYSLIKAAQGNFNQINQFNLIASAYSEAKHANFYKTDRMANFTHHQVPIHKKNRIIQSIEVDNCKHTFQFQDGLINKVDSICEAKEEPTNE
jgi:hypothetical protein